MSRQLICSTVLLTVLLVTGCGKEDKPAETTTPAPSAEGAPAADAAPADAAAPAEAKKEEAKAETEAPTVSPVERMLEEFDNSLSHNRLSAAEETLTKLEAIAGEQDGPTQNRIGQARAALDAKKSPQ